MGEPNLSELVPTSIESFFQGVILPVDVYVRLGSGRFVLLMKAGDAFLLERMKQYQDRNVTELYILRSDHSAFISQQIDIAGIVVARSEITEDKKSAVITQTAKNVFDHIETMGLSKESFEVAKKTASSVMLLACAKNDVARLFEDLSKLKEDIFRHSITVGMMAPMIGHKIGWTRKETLEKLALGGILHDIGKKEIDPKLFERPRSDLTFEEVKEVETHAFRGMQLLKTVPAVPDDVVAMVFEHHENSIGQGYPRHLWDMKTNPMARVVALANAFAELTLESPEFPYPKSPEDAVAHIEKVMGQPFNREAFKALRALVLKK